MAVMDKAGGGSAGGSAGGGSNQNNSNSTSSNNNNSNNNTSSNSSHTGNNNNNNNNSGGGGNSRGGRNRGSRKRNNKRGKQQGGSGGGGNGGGGGGGGGGSKKTSLPPPPQTKITLRLIGNADKFGSVKQVLEDLVRPMMDSINSASGFVASGSCSDAGTMSVASASSDQTSTNWNSFFLQLDEASMRRLIQEEELYRKALAEAEAAAAAAAAASENDQANRENTTVESKGGEETQNGVEKDPSKMDPSEDPTAGSTETEMQKNNKGKTLDVIVNPKKPNNNNSTPIITVRALYVVPPKLTRRRGERTGCAYLVLTAPKIETLRPQTKPEQVQETKRQTPKDVSTTDASVGQEGQEGEGETESRRAAMDTSTAVAKGRLLLQRAIEALTRYADDDCKKGQYQQNYGGCLVEASMSGKTWRHHHHRPDRREGTIESTADFKNWIQSLAQQQEELKARPKPMPGGGAVASSTVAATAAMTTEKSANATETGQPMPAIVLHLRAKRQEAKKRKAKKKKDKNEKSKGGSSNNTKSKKKQENSGKSNSRGGGSNDGNNKGRRDATRKKKKKSVKKKTNNNSIKDSPAPMLLAPPAATAAVG